MLMLIVIKMKECVCGDSEGRQCPASQAEETIRRETETRLKPADR